ncbi:MAG: hypothetical protein MGG37_05035 [Trichodesmium sp. MAG_R01]|nr:hypothetical protein [Trichodesmium sp. MAG_R01]
MIISCFCPLNSDFWLLPNKQQEDSDQTLGVIKRRAGQAQLIILPDNKVLQTIPSIALLEKVPTYTYSWLIIYIDESGMNSQNSKIIDRSKRRTILLTLYRETSRAYQYDRCPVNR